MCNKSDYQSKPRLYWPLSRDNILGRPAKIILKGLTKQIRQQGEGNPSSTRYDEWKTRTVRAKLNSYSSVQPSLQFDCIHAHATARLYSRRKPFKRLRGGGPGTNCRTSWEIVARSIAFVQVSQKPPRFADNAYDFLCNFCWKHFRFRNL
jgi:hypothetical protein